MNSPWEAAQNNWIDGSGPMDGGRYVWEERDGGRVEVIGWIEKLVLCEFIGEQKI